ncbi:MAG: 3-dehydroquinate synthase [Christensenellales bacterium]
MKISVNASKSYDIIIENGVSAEVGRQLRKLASPCKVLLVTDTNVDALYGGGVAKNLSESGFAVYRFLFKAGEESKKLSTVSDMLTCMAGYGFCRSDVIVALGGGVVGDMAGFAASVYMRGIRYIQVPTTLLAAIDSSVGGKTGVDMKEGKNMIGSFWQPEAVLLDPDVIAGLPAPIFSQGVAEAIKYGMIKDRELFYMLDGESDLKEVVSRCVNIKKFVVEQDEYDRGIRQLLNFGHTFGHAIERLSDYRITHGEAVATGMVMAAKAAVRMDFSSEEIVAPLKKCLQKYGLPCECEYSASEIKAALFADKKRSGNATNFILPRRIGECEGFIILDNNLDAFLGIN